MLEKHILNIKQETDYSSTIEKLVHKIKQLAIEMERSNPSEWNSFMEAALEQ
jgi:hypothetical protein